MKSLVLLVGVFFLSGCLIRSEKSDAKIALDHRLSKPTAYDYCTLNVTDTTHDFDLFRPGKDTIGTAPYSFARCHITFGFSDLRHKKHKSSWKKVKKFMDTNGITCAQPEITSLEHKVLIFRFPLHDYGHKDYKDIEITCPIFQSEGQAKIKLTILEHKDGNIMHLDVKQGKKGNENLHFFDTDNKGAIKRHQQIKWRGKVKTVDYILEDYKYYKLQ